MADLLRQGSDWLEAQRKLHAASTVVYGRGAFSVEVAATIGRTVFELENTYGIVEKTESRDFLVLTADLVLDGQAVLPQRGDRIRETCGQQVLVYEVMAPGQEPAWRFSDPYRKTLRIHTKQVTTEDSA